MLVRFGECKRCGQCCKLYLPTVNETMKYTQCPFLLENNLCRIYSERPQLCRNFPEYPAETPPDCGYTWLETDDKRVFSYNVVVWAKREELPQELLLQLEKTECSDCKVSQCSFSVIKVENVNGSQSLLCLMRVPIRNSRWLKEEEMKL